MKYKIRSVENGFIVKHDNKTFTLEYNNISGEGEREKEQSRENYLNAETRLLEYITQRLRIERTTSQSHKMKMVIEWII